MGEGMGGRTDVQTDAISTIRVLFRRGRILRKATISFAKSVHPFFLMEQLVSSARIFMKFDI